MGYGPGMSGDRYASYVLSFERSLRARNRSPNTIYSYLNCLKSAERFLTAHGQARHTANAVTWRATWSTCSAATSRAWWRSTTERLRSSRLAS